MKKSQKGNVSILLIIIILLAIGGGLYFYNKQEEEILIEDITATSTVSTTTDVVENKNTLSDSEFTKTSKDPQTKILAKGDVNNDGYEDAVIQEVFCGASCAVQLKVVLNNKNINATLMNDTTFVPAYNSSGAAKSDVTNVTIKDGIISLTGSGLDCANYQREEPCTQEKWSIIKTVKYKFDGKKMIQLSVVSDVLTSKPIYSKNGLSLNLPSGWKVKIDEGKYAKECDYFAFTPPDYDYKDGFFGGFDLCFGKAASNINDWIIRNAPEYKNKVNLTKGDYLMGDKYTYFVSEIEDENTGISFYTNVILGTKSSYTYHFSQDGANDFPEIIRKNIFPNITIE